MERAADLSLDDIQVGARASFERAFTKDDLARFAELSGDRSPLHTDDAYSEATPYGRPIVYGMLLASLSSCLLGMHLPGRRNVCLSQSFDFASPVYAGDQIEVSGVVVRKHEATRTLTIRIEMRLPPNRVAVRGRALVKVLE